jgi:hypothetical protein
VERRAIGEIVGGHVADDELELGLGPVRRAAAYDEADLLLGLEAELGVEREGDLIVGLLLKADGLVAILCPLFCIATTLTLALAHMQTKALLVESAFITYHSFHQRTTDSGDGAAWLGADGSCMWCDDQSMPTTLSW